jgi:diacylglycerol kinase (ATP)
MAGPEKLLVLFNPSAGGGRAMARKARLESLLREKGVSFELTVTRSEAHLRDLAAAAAGTGRDIVAAGGDSTFHIAAGAILRAGGRSALGLIGLGSSNDISREFGLETMDLAVQAVARARRRKVDLGLITARGLEPVYFLGQANIGLGAAVNRYVARLAEKRSPWARFQTAAGILGIREAYRRREIPLPLRVESGTGASGRRSSYLLAVFSNIRYWASGKKLLPEARPDDGRLDACLFGDCSFARLARLNSLTKRGVHARCPEVEILQASWFEAASDTPFLVQTDGEILRQAGDPEPPALERVRFEALPSALDLIC